MTNFNLETLIIYPDQNEKIKKAIILLHGYGGDANDISMLSYNWKRYLHNTIIICPNGHEKCSLNPIGYQWFDLSVNDEDFILEESKKAEFKINSFIDEVKKKYNLENGDICLSGFSQGCMMALNVGLTSSENYNSIVGFSGKIINKEDLSKRIKSKTRTLLIHGDLDNVVPTHYLLEAKDFLIRNKIEVDTKIINNCEHNIPIEASSTALNFIKQHLYKL